MKRNRRPATQDPTKPSAFSPKDFLRARRPERFSDSTSRETTTVDRSLLEWSLGMITSRSQEADFERFARLLCQREVCPNLLPQTGPVGGGDSKVDSETYPVAPELALRWYVGTTGDPAKERWAFAFSAMKNWRPKVTSDVSKACKTGRGYNKVFFVSNQAIRDKTRAEVEDKLSKENNVTVRILDRTWILDRVFEGRHQELAITELGITGLSADVELKGPRDTARELELEHAEKRITDALAGGTPRPALVDTAIKAANLARELEQPASKLHGVYARAMNLAREYGTAQQLVTAAYEWAWTLYYWLEDFSGFSTAYSDMESLAKDSENPYDIERLQNLWWSLRAAIQRHHIDGSQARYNERTQTLRGALTRLDGLEDRPSARLQGRTGLLLIDLHEGLNDGRDVNKELSDLADVITQAKGLVGYPLEPLVRILGEIGPDLDEHDGYERLFATILETETVRSGDKRAARLLLARGEAELSNGRPVGAIATIGRTLAKLYTHETRHDAVKALYLAACAYDSAGLPWAARAAAIAGASVATNDFWHYGDVTPYQAACYRRIKWLEAKIGRLPQLLDWHMMDLATRTHLADAGYDHGVLFDGEWPFHALLARRLLLKAPEDLTSLVRFPDVLERAGLELPACALQYALGSESRLEAWAKQGGFELDTVLQNWLSVEPSGLGEELASVTDAGLIRLTSSILGCTVRVDCDVTRPCLEVGELILASIESFLATALLQGSAAREPLLQVHVAPGDGITGTFEATMVTREGRPHIDVATGSFDPGALSQGQHNDIQNRLFDVVAKSVGAIAWFQDLEGDLRTLLEKERVAERAVAFAYTFGHLSNTLGAHPKTRHEDWYHGDERSYEYSRELPLRAETPQKQDNAHLKPAPEGPIPPDLADRSNLTHRDMKTVSLIRAPLWNDARWQGVLYACVPGSDQPPIMGLLFENSDAGYDIFRHWREELGEFDSQNRMRVSIVRSLDHTAPHSYRVIFGSNLTAALGNETRFLVVQRTHRMYPADSRNLDTFLNQYALTGAYVLAPVVADPDLDSPYPPVALDVALQLRELNVKDAWQLGPNDVERAGLAPDERPSGPPKTEKSKNAQKRERRQRKKK